MIRSRLFWPLFISLLAMCVAVLSVWSIRKASSTGSDVIDRDYYQRGIDYDSIRAAQWRATPSLEDGALLITVTSEKNTPLTGATVTLDLPPAPMLTLSEGPNGIYSAQLMLQRQAIGVITVSKGETQMKQHVVIQP